jgi:FMN-dependent NADH-azoreductase
VRSGRNQRELEQRVSAELISRCNSAPKVDCYPRHLLGFIGLTDIEIVGVEGTVFGPEAAKAAIDATEAQVRSVLEKAS